MTPPESPSKSAGKRYEQPQNWRQLAGERTGGADNYAGPNPSNPDSPQSRDSRESSSTHTLSTSSGGNSRGSPKRHEFPGNDNVFAIAGSSGKLMSGGADNPERPPGDLGALEAGRSERESVQKVVIRMKAAKKGYGKGAGAKLVLDNMNMTVTKGKM